MPNGVKHGLQVLPGLLKRPVEGMPAQEVAQIDQRREWSEDLAGGNNVIVELSTSG